MNYFKKELVRNRLFRKNGAQVEFTSLGDSIGILATDEAQLITELNGLIKEQRGGVAEITAEEYEELKKNPPAARSPRRFFDQIRAANQARQPQAIPQAPAADVAVGVEPPQTSPGPSPRKVPIVNTDKIKAEPIPKPRTARWKMLPGNSTQTPEPTQADAVPA